MCASYLIAFIFITRPIGMSVVLSLTAPTISMRYVSILIYGRRVKQLFYFTMH